jgi:regulator of RNase E activity RraA
MVVSPRDIIVGDANGIVCVPPHSGNTSAFAEHELLSAVQHRYLDRAWIDKALRTGGCEDLREGDPVTF